MLRGHRFFKSCQPLATAAIRTCVDARPKWCSFSSSAMVDDVDNEAGPSLQKAFQKSVRGTPASNAAMEVSDGPEPVAIPTTPPKQVQAQAPPSPAPLPAAAPKLQAPGPPPIQGHFHEFAPKICVVGVGGAGGNAVNNMIARQLGGVDFLVANTDAQHLSCCLTDNRLQLGTAVTHGLGCGANPDQGRLAAMESQAEILERLGDAHMVFITAGMGGGTGTGAAPVIAQTCLDHGILTVAVVTTPFLFEGTHRMRLAREGLSQLSDCVDTLIPIPNQNLFKLVDKKTAMADAFQIADDVLLAGVKGVTDLMVKPGLINLDFADVKSIMENMGNAMMGTGHCDEGEDRALRAAEDALSNPLLGDISIKSAKGVLVNITGGNDLTLWEVNEAANRITEEIEDDYANIIFGSAYDNSLDGAIRVSVVATGIEDENITH